jgi:hypothetical protein
MEPLSHLSNESRLRALSVIGRSIRAGCLDPVLDPYIDGRTEDVRTPALKQAIADLLAAVDRLEATAKGDLASWASAARAGTLNRERHERAEREQA